MFVSLVVGDTSSAIDVNVILPSLIDGFYDSFRRLYIYVLERRTHNLLGIASSLEFYNASLEYRDALA